MPKYICIKRNCYLCVVDDRDDSQTANGRDTFCMGFGEARGQSVDFPQSYPFYYDFSAESASVICRKLDMPIYHFTIYVSILALREYSLLKNFIYPKLCNYIVGLLVNF